MERRIVNVLLQVVIVDTLSISESLQNTLEAAVDT